MSVKDPPRQSTRPLSEWDLANVSSWLEGLNLGQYRSAFEANEIDGSILPCLDHQVLKDLGIEPVGHRLKILRSIYIIKQDQENQNTISPNDSKPFTPWDGVRSSVLSESSDSIRLDRLLKSLELRDERIMYAENETRRIWDSYQRLREELMPVFRIVKESKPLPTPDSNTAALNRSSINNDQVSKQLHIPLSRSQNPSHLNLSPHGQSVSPGLASPLGVAPAGQMGEGTRSQHLVESPGSAKRMSFISPDSTVRASAGGSGIGGSRSNQQLAANLGNLSSTPAGSRSSMIDSSTSGGGGHHVPVSGGGAASHGSQSSSAMHDPFKSFKLSPDDPCSKVLPAVVRKYKIVDDWRMYRLVLSYEGTERVLDLDDKPLAVFKELHSAGKQPFFMLRHVEDPAKK